MHGFSFTLHAPLKPEEDRKKNPQNQENESHPENRPSHGERNIVAHDANDAFGGKDPIGRAHLVSRGVAAFTEIRPACVLKGVVREADGFPFVIYVGRANLIGFLVKVNEFGNTMAGLALNSQVRCMDLARAIMNGMAAQALGACYGLVWGTRHIRMALDAAHKTVTSLSNFYGINFQGNFGFVDGFDTGVFLVAFQTEGLGSKPTGIGLYIGKTVAVQAIPLLSFQLRGHHGFDFPGIYLNRQKEESQTNA